MRKWIYFAAGFILAQGTVFRVSGWDDAPNLLPLRLLFAAGSAFLLARWAVEGMEEHAQLHAQVRRKVSGLVPIRELETRESRQVLAAAGGASFAVLALTSVVGEFPQSGDLLLALAAQAALWAVVVVLFIVRELYFVDEDVAQRPNFVYVGWIGAIIVAAIGYLVASAFIFLAILIVWSLHGRGSTRFFGWVMEPYKQSDYEEAIRRAEQAVELSDLLLLPQKTYFNVLAGANLDGLRFEDAARVALKVLNAKGIINMDKMTYAGMLNVLAMVAFERNNLQEAAQLSSVAAELLPVEEVYETQAYMYLQKGANAAGALQILSETQDVYEHTTTIKLGERALALGDKAWALALQKEFDQISRLLKKGQSKLKDMDPINAAFHYRAGMARLIQKQFDAAVTHYETAVNLDPEGYWGSKAREVLDKRNEPSPLQDVYEQARQTDRYRLE